MTNSRRATTGGMKAYKRVCDVNGQVSNSGCDVVGKGGKAVYGTKNYDSKVGCILNGCKFQQITHPTNGGCAIAVFFHTPYKHRVRKGFVFYTPYKRRVRKFFFLHTLQT
jgi:hypothetical protein